MVRLQSLGGKAHATVCNKVMVTEPDPDKDDT